MFREKKQEEKLQQNVIKMFTHVRHRLKKSSMIKRDMIVVNGYGFYNSTGINSKLSGIWFPFLQVKDTTRKIDSGTRHGYIVKTTLITHSSTSSFNDYCDDKGLRAILEKDKIFRRFGNLETILLSIAIDESAWVANFSKTPLLKDLYNYIYKNPKYVNYIQSIKNKNYVLESKTATPYFAYILTDMQKLNQDLESAGKRYGKENFPKDDLEMQQRIEGAPFQTQLSNLLGEFSKTKEYESVITQCLEIMNHSQAEPWMKQAVFKTAIGLALLPPKGFHLFFSQSHLGKLAVKLLNTPEYGSLARYIKTIAEIDNQTYIRYADLARFTPQQNLEEIQEKLNQVKSAVKEKAESGLKNSS
ncbi:MAG TPA: hypothetical protein VHM20_06485 [Gammaproteobacteria bacterium]|jgi:hypothetical protein|nr:hypothetical protein [Gammaproteobacteria bacterium]